MLTTKLDKRSIRTRAAIESSLLRMLNTVPLDGISIKKLCEDANVNRTTFYLHYSGINNILDSISEDFIGRVLANYPAPSAAKNDGAYINFLKAVNDEIDKTPMLENFLKSSKEAGIFIQHLKESFYLKIYSVLEPETVSDKKEHCAFITTFLCSGVIDSYFLWLKNGKKVSLDAMCKSFSALINEGHSRFL